MTERDKKIKEEIKSMLLDYSFYSDIYQTSIMNMVNCETLCEEIDEIFSKYTTEN